MVKSVQRVSVAILAVIAAVPLAALPVTAGTTPQSAEWAWATVRRLGVDHEPAVKDRGLSNAAGSVFVDHLGAPGRYDVYFNLVHADTAVRPSVALVSPLGTVGRTCGTIAWSRPALTFNEVVSIQCHALDGTPAESRFVVNWLEANGEAAAGGGGRLGYGLNWSPTSNCGGPIEAYQSYGGLIVTCPVGTFAQMRFGSLGTDGGVALVSAMTKLRFTDGDWPGSCSLVEYAAGLDATLDEAVNVTCWEPDGDDEIYRQHVVVFMKGLGLKGIVRKHVAWVAATRPTTAAYKPTSLRRYNSTGGVNAIARLGTGRYVVTLPGMPLGGGAQVTAYDGTERRVCAIESIGRTVLPQRVRVRCTDGAGTLRDTRFTLAYTR